MIETHASPRRLRESGSRRRRTRSTQSFARARRKGVAPWLAPCSEAGTANGTGIPASAALAGELVD